MTKHIINALLAAMLVLFSTHSIANNNQQIENTNCNKPKKFLNTSYSQDKRLYFEVYYQCEVTTVHIKNNAESNVYKYTFYVSVNDDFESVVIPAGKSWTHPFNSGRKTSFKINYITELCMVLSTDDESTKRQKLKECY